MNEWKEFLIEDLAEFCNAKRVPLSSMQRQQLQGSYCISPRKNGQLTC